jgi:hypothetical protein
MKYFSHYNMTESDDNAVDDNQMSSEVLDSRENGRNVSKPLHIKI